MYKKNKRDKVEQWDIAVDMMYFNGSDNISFGGRVISGC